MEETQELDVSEIEDFDVAKPRYETWLFTLDSNNMAQPFDCKAGEFEELDEAIIQAETYYEHPELVGCDLPEDAKYLVIQVEAIVDPEDEDGDPTTLVEYNRIIEIVREA